MTDQVSLFWEITPDEKRQRTGRLVKTVFVPMVGMALFAFTIAYPTTFFYSLVSKGASKTLIEVLIYTAIVAITMLLLFAANKIIPYAHRTYILNNEGLRITKNRKKKVYGWDQFSLFYDYSERGQANDLKAEEARISGKIFYLKVKTRFFKKFVVMYAEPDNSDKVYEYLKAHLKEEKMLDTSDLGMVFYEFK
jgi:hypothetical protein